MAKKNRNRIRSVVEPFSPRQIRREANARTRLEFGDTGRALRGDLRANAQDRRNTNAWFQQYQNTMAGLRAEQDRANAGLRERMGQGAATLGTQGAARSDAVQSDQDRSAAIRGAVADTGAKATEGAAESQRQALMGLARDRADQMGESSQSRLRQVNSAAELGRQADIRGIRNEALETRSKMRDLARDKGAARVKNMGDLTRGERDFYIQRRTLNSNIRNDQQQLALDRQRENRIASEGSGGSGGSGGGGKGAGGYKGGEIRAGLAEGRKVLAESSISAKNPKGIRQNKQGIIDALTAHPNPIDVRLAQIVYRRLLKRAIRWDRNPNNVGSSAWNDQRPR